MKTLFKSIIFLVILQGCSSSRFMLQEYKNDPSLYYPSFYTLEDGRVYDEYPNTMCQLDKCTLEEFMSVLAGEPLFKRREAQIENPLLTTSYEKILKLSFENAELQTGVNPATVSLWVTCIGFSNDGGLQVTVKGEMYYKGQLIWKNTGVAMRQYPYTVTWIELQKEDWDRSISETTIKAINNCLKRMPKNK